MIVFLRAQLRSLKIKSFFAGLTITALVPLSVVGQEFNGYIHSDFSGILSARTQPAALANSPYKFDFNIINANYYLTNNIAYTENGSEGTRLIRFIGQNEKFLHANVALGGLSALFSLPRNQGLGIQFQVRAIGSTSDLTPNFITQLNRFSDARFLSSTETDEAAEFAFSMWQELALTYAFVKKDDGFHRWKVGATLKFVNPMGNVLLDMEDIDYTIDNTGQVEFNNFSVQAGYSSNLDRFEQFDGTESLGLPKGTGFKPAADIGIVYERVAYRPDPRGDKGTGLKPDVTYEFRLGASITDIGVMTFDRGTASFSSNGIIPGIQGLDDLFDDLDSFRELRDSLATRLIIQDAVGSYTVSLPTSLNLNYDYNFGNNFYFNLAGRFDLSWLMPADYRINYPGSITATPRYETGLSGFYMPVYFNFEGDTDLGLAFRYGPVTLGTPSFGSLLSSRRKSGGVFLSLNINQLKANSDKPYCFGSSRVGSGFTRTKRTPLYKRKKFLFF